MNNKGYLLLPRSICNQPWYRRPTCRLLAYHLLQEASYKATEHPVLGALPAGSYVTSTRGLAEELGVSHQEIRTAISALIESEFLTVESFGVGRYGGLKIVIIWADFTSLRDGDIMLNNTLSNTLDNTLDNTLNNSTTDEVSGSYKDVEVETNTLSNTLDNTLNNTANINKNITNTLTEDNNNPGNNQNAPARDAHPRMSAQAQALGEWITKHTPEIASMEVPLTPEQLEYLSAKYDSETLHRVMTDCESTNGHLRHRRAFNAVQIYLDYDRRVKQSNKLYTYDEFCDQLKRYGRRQDEFTLVEVGGRKMWKRLS